MNEILSSFSPELFAGKTVLVSGATRGIGLGIARGFAELGASVIATGSKPDQAPAEAAKSAGPTLRLEFRKLDVRDTHAIRTLISGLERLDVLVNCAGIARPRAEHDEENYREVMEVNLNSAMWASSAARPLLADAGGSIVNIASMLSYLADPAVPAYCASKTGLLGLTRSLAFAYGPQIRVNAIAPGYHKTEMTKVHWTQPAVEKTIAERSALKRWGDVDDLVGAALFLASPAARFITGTCLVVDGGYSIG